MHEFSTKQPGGLEQFDSVVGQVRGEAMNGREVKGVISKADGRTEVVLTIEPKPEVEATE